MAKYIIFRMMGLIFVLDLLFWVGKFHRVLFQEQRWWGWGRRDGIAPLFFLFVKWNHSILQIFAFAIFSYYPPINLAMPCLFSAGRSDAISLWLCDFDKSSIHHSWESNGRVMEEVLRKALKVFGTMQKMLQIQYTTSWDLFDALIECKCMLFRWCGLLTQINQL